jgi:hypothetical protein
MKIPGPLVRVESVEPLENFMVRVTFKNGVVKEIDLERFLRGEMFEEIRRDQNVFRSVKVMGATIGWENGADIDPDVLYYDLEPAWMEKQVKA